MKQVRESNAAKSISAYIVIKKNKLVAKVQILYGNSRVQADVWNHGKGTQELQQGSASGYGYDKATAAMRGLVIDGITLNDHCEHDQRTERLLQRYLDAVISKRFDKCAVQQIEDQAKKDASKIGAHFANYRKIFVRPDGTEVEKWNLAEDGSEDSLLSYWRYGSLFLESGLKKLELLGYQVINAI